MKKIAILLLITLSLSGCKTPSVTSRKLDRKPQIAIKGSWTLSAISYPGQDYIKVNAFDSTLGFETMRLSFIVNRPKHEPGFALVRQEGAGRQIHYTVTSYATGKPEGERY